MHSISRNLLILLLTSASSATPLPLVTTSATPDSPCSLPDGVLIYPGQQKVFPENFSCLIYECTAENGLVTIVGDCSTPFCLDAKFPTFDSCCRECPNGQNCLLPNGEILNGTEERAIGEMSCKCPDSGDEIGPQQERHITAVCEPLPMLTSIISPAGGSDTVIQTMSLPETKCQMHDGTILYPGQRVMDRQNASSCAYYECTEENQLKTVVFYCKPPRCVDAQYLSANSCCPHCPNGQNCLLPNGEILEGTGEQEIEGMSCKCSWIVEDGYQDGWQMEAKCQPLSVTPEIITSNYIISAREVGSKNKRILTKKKRCTSPDGTILRPGQKVMIRQNLYSCAYHTCISDNQIDTLFVTCSQPMCEDAQYLNSSVCCLPCPIGQMCRLPNNEILKGSEERVIEGMSCKCPEFDPNDDTPIARLKEAKCYPLSGTVETTYDITTPQTQCHVPNGTDLFPGQRILIRQGFFSCAIHTCNSDSRIDTLVITCSQPMCEDAQYLNSSVCCLPCPVGPICRLPNGKILNGTESKVIDGMSCKCPEIDPDDETPKVRLDKAKCQPLSPTLHITTGTTTNATTYNSTGSLTFTTPETPCRTPNGTVLYPGQQVTEREDIFSCIIYTCIAGNQLTEMTVSCSQPMCVDAQYLDSFSCCRHCPNGQNCRLPNGEILSGTERRVIDGMSCKCPKIVPDDQTPNVRLDEAKCQPLLSTLQTTAGTTTITTTYNSTASTYNSTATTYNSTASTYNSTATTYNFIATTYKSTASLTVTTPETPCRTPNGTVLYPGQQVTEREDVFSCIFYTCIAGNQLTEMTVSCSQPMCVDAQYLDSFSCCRHCPNGQNCRLPNGEILSGTERKVINGKSCKCPEVDLDDEAPNVRMDEAKCQPLSSTLHTTAGTTTIHTTYNSTASLTVTTPETPCQTPNGTILYPGQQVTEREDVFSCVFYTCISANHLTGMTISCSQSMCVDAQYLNSFSCCRHCPNGQNCRLPNGDIMNGTEIKVIEGMRCKCPEVHPNVDPPSAECQPQSLTLGVISITASPAMIASANTIAFHNISLFINATSSTATPTIIASSNTSSSIEFSASSSTTTPTNSTASSSTFTLKFISDSNSFTTPTTISARNSTTTPTINASSNTTTPTNISASSNTPTISTSKDTTIPTSISSTINTTTLTTISASISTNTPTISASTNTTIPTTTSASNNTTIPTTISASSNTTVPTTISAFSNTTIPTTISASSNTTIPTVISASSNTIKPTTISASSNTTLPTTISASSNTTTLITISASSNTPITTTISASSNTTIPKTISASSNTTTLTTISASSNSTIPTTISASISTTTLSISASSNTTIPTTISASSNTTIPTTISASSNTTIPTSISASSNTTIPTSISASSNTTMPTTISASSNTTIPTTITASSNTTIPTTTSASSNTTTLTTISASSNTPIPTTISASSNTTIPTTISASSNTTILTNISASSNTTIPTTISASSNTTIPTTISASSNTTILTNISASSNTTIPTTISASSNTTIPTTISASSNTTILTNISLSNNTNG